MAENKNLADDWRWFQPYRGVPSRDAEVALWEGGKVYRTTQDQMRRADGRGWLWLTDSVHTSDSKQAVTADTKTRITIDGEGAATDTRFRDGLPISVWAGDTLTPQAVGETYLLRLQMIVSPTASSTGEYFRLHLDISGDLGVVWEATRPLLKGQGNEDFISAAIPIFCLETFFANGGEFYFTPSVGVNLWDKAIMIQRMRQP